MRHLLTLNHAYQTLSSEAIEVSNEPTTLLGREEGKGRPYPLFLERLMLVAVIVMTVVYGGNISDQFNTNWLGFGIGFVAFPLLLLAASEMIGRMIQSKQ